MVDTEIPLPTNRWKQCLFLSGSFARWSKFNQKSEAPTQGAGILNRVPGARSPSILCRGPKSCFDRYCYSSLAAQETFMSTQVPLLHPSRWFQALIIII